MSRRGFTLIELSIVLVIIGLIVGGVLVGQDLIRSAASRATIAQIEKYNTAVNDFRGKYGALPGDMNAAAAAQFGFGARGAYAGEGDGNGVIEGINANSSDANNGLCITGGETAMFWVDLSHAGLVDGSFTTAAETAAPTPANYAAYYPQAKINGNYIFAWSGGWPVMTSGAPALSDGLNYFGLQGISGFTNNCFPNVSYALTVQQAYSIDKKVDDGLPLTGNVTTLVEDSNDAWANNPTLSGPFTSATAGSTTSCFDNGNSAGATQQYSLAQNGGSGMNCGLSFRFQ